MSKKVIFVLMYRRHKPLSHKYVVSFKIILFIFITACVDVVRTLLLVVTCAVLLDKLGYFVAAFYVVIGGPVPRFVGDFKFYILWSVPWLCPCSTFRCYHDDVSFLVLLTGFLVGDVLYCFCSCDTAPCCVAGNEHFMQLEHSSRCSQ
jgi:hypothetical protein